MGYDVIDTDKGEAVREERKKEVAGSLRNVFIVPGRDDSFKTSHPMHVFDC